MIRYIWLVPILPLLGAAINGLLGKRFRFSESLIGGIAVGSVLCAFLLSLAAVYSYGFGSTARWPAPYLTSQDGAFKYTWIPSGAIEVKGVGAQTEGQSGGENAQVTANQNRPHGSLLDVEWSYQLDPLSAVFMLIVTGVGLCIFIFATGYMHGDAGFYRFFAYLGLFMFSMLVLVMGSNFLMMFVGWEGVGLCSYLLIGYYFDRREAGDAARKAFITNRIGDYGFALAVFAIITTFGSAQYSTVFSNAAGYPVEAIGTWGIMSWIALGLFVGACGKSAQIPLFVWLPDAMAGPTPVSALIHAATMVTAGIYMVTRTNVIFQHSQTMMLVVAVVGAATAIFAATIGITQNDIKKVLAYSTVSQLGFMFMACGVGAFAIGVFHVMTHAFFKALLFLGAGSVIQGMHHEQDLRRMGGLKRYMPYTYATFLIGWLAICGVIPLSGFWSKDEILWRAASTPYIPGGGWLWLIGMIAAVCTAFYMTRLVAMAFWGKERFFDVAAGDEADEAHAHAYDEGLAPHDAATFSAGDRPGHEPGEHVGLAHDVGVGHAHGLSHSGIDHGAHIPKESPPSMWVPLVVLAILAAVGGFVGVGPAFKSITGSEHPGGRLNIETWLSPVIWNPATKGRGENAESATGSPEVLDAAHPRPVEVAHGADSSSAVSAYESIPQHSANLASMVEAQLGNHKATEWFFIIISLIAAGVGMLLGALFYVWRPVLPTVWVQRLGPLYRLSLNKYWVDEVYGLLFTRRLNDLSRAVYWFDSKVIDGIVNGVASLTRFSSLFVGAFDKYVVDGIVNAIGSFIRNLMSGVIRAAQTGLAPNYALVMVLGLVAAVAIFFGSDILSEIRALLITAK
jgi:NADH-quinone oxidoreductase subunit L